MVTGALIVLIHSPLVGPITWRGVAGLLESRGWRTCVPDLSGAMDQRPPYYGALAQHVARDLPESEQLVLVGHSFAGVLLPAIGGATTAGVVDHIYVDAVLPQPGNSWFDTVPPEFASQVRSLARDGVLPPWHEWFSADAIAAVLPDASLREHFTAEIRGLPLALFDEPQPAVADRSRRHAYLQLSLVYEPLADEAEAGGWPTLRESADHVAMLTRPELVTDGLIQLLEALP